MCRLLNQIITLPFLFIILTAGMSNIAKADEWLVQKISGDVWVETDKPTKIALTKETKLKNGDKIRTGQRGRVLLKRNKETILISPNSVIGLPETPTENGKTVILQQAGKILLDVEKKNVKHFEVSTPYLAAVVKGTQFSVTVDAKGTQVNVLRGKVEVSDFKTGQFVLVKPGQTALVNAQNKLSNIPLGIKLKGRGKKEKIQQGVPRKQRVAPIKFQKPSEQKAQKSASLQDPERPNSKTAKKPAHKKHKTKSHRKKRSKFRFRISRTLGHVTLNAHKSTRGLAKTIRHAALNRKKRKVNNNKATYWAVVNGNAASAISSSVTKNNKSVKKGNSSNNNLANQNSILNSTSNGNSVSNSVSAVTSVSALSSSINNNGNGNVISANASNNGGGNSHGGWWALLIQAWQNYKNSQNND